MLAQHSTSHRPSKSPFDRGACQAGLPHWGVIARSPLYQFVRVQRTNAFRSTTNVAKLDVAKLDDVGAGPELNAYYVHPSPGR